MFHRVFLGITLLLACIMLSMHASCQIADSWLEIEVLSFNGESILFNVKIFTKGNHADQTMWIRNVPVTNGGVEIWKQRLCDVVFHEEMNITVFSSHYSYSGPYYNANPKWFGTLVFPFDNHELHIYISPSFNLTIDKNYWILSCPQNYEGKIQITPSPTEWHPFLHEIVLDIKHSSSFTVAVSVMVFVTMGATYALTIFLMIVIIITSRKESNELIPNLIRISSALVFFIPVFEIALFNLKSPLPLVFSDILLISLIPWNIVIMIAEVLLFGKKHLK